MLFVSIHPRYVEAILDGRKTVELRKRMPRAESGTQLAIYASMPKCAVVASAVIDRIEAAKPERMWPQVRKIAAVTRQEFNEYFCDHTVAVAIHFSGVRVFEEPITLSELREAWQTFHPPQQFRYLDEIQQQSITSRSVHRVLS
jgi:predicted transcriptional regulator